MCERRNVYKNPFSIARGLPVSVKRIGEFIRRQVALVSNRFTEVKPYTRLYTLTHAYTRLHTLIHAYTRLYTLTHAYTRLHTLTHAIHAYTRLQWHLLHYLTLQDIATATVHNIRWWIRPSVA